MTGCIIALSDKQRKFLDDMLRENLILCVRVLNAGMTTKEALVTTVDAMTTMREIRDKVH